MTVDITSIILISVPTVIVLGIRHALDIDHITAIDNLVRLHNAIKKSRWVGGAFSSGHMIAVLLEMILIIYVIGSVINIGNIAFIGGIIGAIALGIIGSINIYTIKKWGKSGSAILASKILNRTGMLGPVGSSLVTGLVFGLGFDTATQIAAITVSAVASATLGVQISLMLVGFFALGMIPIDTLDGIILRSAFSKIFTTKAFQYMSYALSGIAVTVALATSYESLTGTEILPRWAGPVLAVTIISISIGYAYSSRKNKVSHSHDIEESDHKAE